MDFLWVAVRRLILAHARPFSSWQNAWHSRARRDGLMAYSGNMDAGKAVRRFVIGKL